MRRQPVIDYLAIAAIAIGLVLGAVAVAGGGVGTSFGGLRVSSRTLFRPTLLVCAAVLVLAATSTIRERQLKNALAALRSRSTLVAVCLVALSLVAAIRFGTFEAGAADQYGYVSQAGLWVKGELTVAQPLASRV